MYTQNTKTVADTIRDNRIDIYMPWKPVVLDGFDIMHEITAVTLAGAVQADNGVGTVYAGLSSACDQIESLQFLHGNGSGEIIYQISNCAFAYLQAMFKGSRDPSKYGLYINSKTEDYNVMYEESKAVDVAGLNTILNLALTNKTIGKYSGDANFNGGYTVEEQLILNIQKERYDKFR